MRCKIKYGDEEKESELFVQEDEKEGENLGPSFNEQVWQGRLRESFFPFEMVLEDEPAQPRSLEIKVCEVGESMEASLGLV